jgi:hypothetical protein
MCECGLDACECGRRRSGGSTHTRGIDACVCAGSVHARGIDACTRDRCSRAGSTRTCGIEACGACQLESAPDASLNWPPHCRAASCLRSPAQQGRQGRGWVQVATAYLSIVTPLTKEHEQELDVAFNLPEDKQRGKGGEEEQVRVRKRRVEESRWGTRRGHAAPARHPRASKSSAPAMRAAPSRRAPHAAGHA